MKLSEWIGQQLWRLEPTMCEYCQNQFEDEICNCFCNNGSCFEPDKVWLDQHPDIEPDDE